VPAPHPQTTVPTKRNVPAIGLIFGLLILAVLTGIAMLGIPYLSAMAKAVVLAVLSLGLIFVAGRVLRRFLWRVGRRLAFSYFLLGVLPIPLVTTLALLGLYQLGGLFLGHLYRDGAAQLQRALETSARARLAHWTVETEIPKADGGPLAFAYYRDGKRVAGDPHGPVEFPAWLGESGKDVGIRYAALEDGSPTLATAISEARYGVVAFYKENVSAPLSDAARVGVKLVRSDQPESALGWRLKLFGRDITLRPFKRGQAAGTIGAAGASTGGQPSSYGLVLDRDPANSIRAGDERPWKDRELFWWRDLSKPLRALSDGRPVAEFLASNLTASPRAVSKQLFSAAPEVDASAWVVLIIVGIQLWLIYVVAAAMALFMILGLSRAVNRLSTATEAVRAGDFSQRIPVRRKDQLGDLQRSFNEMSEHLEELVASGAQKEAIERELELARSLQKRLIPAQASQGDGVEFATHFEPSAAIGGDYFDILRLDRDRLAVVIADVSGHGLSAGLRMAMLKAGLQILVEESHEANEILRRLDNLVRSSDEGRAFVTASLSLIDVRRGRLEITNAGHPPLYLFRGDEVEEILLPGSPLGGLGHTYGQRQVPIQPGDVLVWLSDGLIEACGPEGLPFGYERVRRTIAAGSAVPFEVRDRLLLAVAEHARGLPAEDDRTLVVMRYQPGISAAS
jgi:sigma-B regulation protein RsbU (phosphoserine phosphatase)